jgi:hypothetical protein
MDPLQILTLPKPKYLFLALKIQMEHGIRDKLTDYCVTVKQLYTPFYGTMMKRE